MAESLGKCTNYARCTLAYKNEAIPFTGDPVCPECGQPLTLGAGSGKSSRKLLIVGGAVCAAIVLGAGLYVATLLMRYHAPRSDPAGKVSAAPAQSSPPAPEAEPPAPAPNPSVAASSGESSTAVPIPPPPPKPPEETPASPPSAGAGPPPSPPPPQTIAGLTPPRLPSEGEPLEPVSVEKSIDTNIQGAENGRVRAEVLKRIDLMPNLSSGDRDKLYARVDRARGMGKVITVPFELGSRAVGAREIEQLKSALQSPQVASLTKDPSVVFVLLGFADKRGDEKANQKISLDRAENISQTLRDKCGLQNVMQPVGMGGSALFDSGNFAKNRVVEVWAVVP